MSSVGKTGSRGHPSITELRAAIRDVRAAPHGRTALAFLRPRRVAPLTGDRAPLLVVLLLARMEHRLAWLGPSGFAIIEPPLLSPRRSAPSRAARCLRFADEHWSSLALAVPGLLMIALGLLLSSFLGLLTALFAAMASLLYVAILMLSGLVWQVFFAERRRAGSVPTGTEWTMSLFHQEDDHRIDELMGVTELLLRHAVVREARLVTVDRDTQLGQVRVSARLWCPREAITTEAARTLVGTESPRVVTDTDGSSVRLFDERAEDLPRAPERIRFFRWFALAVVLVVLYLAWIVTERQGGQLGYWDAVLWVLYQFVWRSPAGISPVGYEVRVVSLMLMPVLPIGLAVAFVANRSRRELLTKRIDQMAELLRRTVGKTRILIVTVATVERQAMLKVLEEHTRTKPERNFGYSVPVYEAGVVGNARIFVIQVQQGDTGATGVITAAGAAMTALDPHYAVITGICWGLRPDEQSPGDICVATRVRDLNHVKLVDGDHGVGVIDRGENEAPPAVPLHIFQATEPDWTRSGGAPVHFGPMMALNALVNSRPVASALRAVHPDAIAADMEGAGFRAAAKAANVTWGLVKAICDFGTDKDDRHQEKAARNSAEFVLRAIALNAFDTTVEAKLGR